MVPIHYDPLGWHTVVDPHMEVIVTSDGLVNHRVTGIVAFDGDDERRSFRCLFLSAHRRKESPPLSPTVFL